MNPPIVLDVEPRKLNMGTYNVERTMVRFAMTDVFVLSKLHFEPCHVPLKYRYPTKKDDDIRPIHLIEVSRHFSHFKARKWHSCTTKAFKNPWQEKCYRIGIYTCRRWPSIFYSWSNTITCSGDIGEGKLWTNMEKNKHNKHSPTNARIFKTRVWGHTTYYRSLEGTQVQYNETLPDYFQMLQSEPKIAYFQNHEKN